MRKAGVKRRGVLRSFFLFGLIFQLFTLQALAASQEKKGKDAESEKQWSLVRDLNEEWVYYDEEEGIFAPVQHETHFNLALGGIFIDLSQHRPYFLRLCFNDKTSLFIDGKLVDHFSAKEECKIYSVDSLARQYARDSIFILAYQAKPSFKLPEVSLLSLGRKAQNEVRFWEDDYQLKGRMTSPVRNTFYLSFLLVLSFLAYTYSSAPRLTKSFLDLYRTYSFRVRDESIFNSKLASNNNLILYAIYGMSFALLIIYLTFYTAGRRFSLVGWELSFFSLALDWLLYTFLVWGLLLSKYIWVHFVSTIFNVKGFADIHFLEFTRMSFQAYVFLLFISVIGMNVDWFSLERWGQIMLWAVLAMWTLRSLFIFFKLISQTRHTKFYLFSYLCTTEIIPVILALKLFFIDFI